MVVVVDSDDSLSKGRGHNFQHLGRCAGQVRQVELQVLRQDWSILEEMPLILILQLLTS